MKNIALLFAAFTYFSITAQNTSKQDFIRENFAFAQQQLAPQVALTPDSDGYPRTLKNNLLRCTKKNDWTEGFFPGSLWYVYEYTKNEADKQNALKWTLPLAQLQYLTSHHDIGFLMYCSYGNGYRLTHDEAYKQILIQSAKSLLSRYDSVPGVIKSWNYRTSWDKKHQWHYPVIIDNMMNLELLYFASKVTGDPVYARIATRHAEVTMKNHIRPDYGTYHVVNYDVQTGNVLFSGTCQGFADNSTWARGQAWAIYGYTMVYRETGDKRFLRCAEKLADFWLNHPNLPQDGIPYWDFDVPNEHVLPADWSKKQAFDRVNPPRDASAAAVTCSALFELSQQSPHGKKYYHTAEKMLRILSRFPYRSQPGANFGFILDHSVGSLPHSSEIDVPLVYADYYFLEALHRYRQLLK